MDASTIRTLGDLVEAAKIACEGLNARVVWYRGQGDSVWALHPSVYRTNHWAGRYEIDLTWEFYLRAPSRYVGCPRHNDPLGWLTLMRHHGLPTRLLDWTESILVAAYFALDHEAPAGRPAAIWALAPTLLNAETSKSCSRQIAQSLDSSGTQRSAESDRHLSSLSSQSRLRPA